MSDGAIPARRLLSWVWRDYLKRRVGALGLAFVFMAAEGASVGALSYLVRPLFDGIRPGADMAIVYAVAFSVAAVFITRAIAGFAHRVIMARQAEKAAAEMQQDLLTHAMRLDLAFFLANPPGGLIERIRGDTAMLKAQWPTILQVMGRDTIGLVSLLGVALVIDWRWTLIAVVGVPVLIGPLTLLQRRVRSAARQASLAAALLSTPRVTTEDPATLMISDPLPRTTVGAAVESSNSMLWLR